MPFVSATEDLERILRTARRVAVLGIKPDTRADLDGHTIPLYLSEVGYEIEPVLTRYPDEQRVMGRPVHRSLGTVPKPVDILSVFLKPEQGAAFVEDILALAPGVVWFQSGLLEREVGLRLVGAGLVVVHECIGCRRASIAPSWSPLWGE